MITQINIPNVNKIDGRKDKIEITSTHQYTNLDSAEFVMDFGYHFKSLGHYIGSTSLKKKYLYQPILYPGGVGLGVREKRCFMYNNPWLLFLLLLFF
jgi:hypothetical protein